MDSFGRLFLSFVQNSMERFRESVRERVRSSGEGKKDRRNEKAMFTPILPRSGVTSLNAPSPLWVKPKRVRMILFSILMASWASVSVRIIEITGRKFFRRDRHPGCRNNHGRSDIR